MSNIITTENGFRVQGSVSFDNVVGLRFQGEKLISQRGAPKKFFEIELSEMKDQDASSVSLLLCWKRYARKKQCELQVKGAPLSFQRMQKMFGLING